jgi:hypothetical protein
MEILGRLISVLALAYIPLQVYTVIRWSGVWRIAALMPLLLIFAAYPFAYRFIASAVSDRNNQFGPFGWIVLWLFFGWVGASIGCGYLVVLMVLRAWVTGQQRKDGRGDPLETAARSLPPTSSQEDIRIQGK